MKEFKQALIDEIVREAHGKRIVKLHDVGAHLGHSHISTRDCLDILNAAKQRLTGYKIVKLVAPGQADATASLWTTGALVDESLEFEEE